MIKRATWMAGLLCGLGALPLQAQITLPEYTGESLYVLTENPPGFDTDSLRRELDMINHGSERAYQVVILDSAGESAFAARDYNEELRMQWQKQAAREGGSFDARTDVIIVLTVQDRRISLRGGNVLELRYGLTDSVIERELVQPYFVPTAQQESPTAALAGLVRETEDWLNARNLRPAPAPMVDTGMKVVRGHRPDARPARPTAAPAHRSSRKAGFLDMGLPVFLFAAIGVGALSLIVGRFRRRARLRASVVEPYEQYANKVAALLDRVEQLTRRHQLLPYSDPDYTEPMVGETLARYDAVDDRIRGLREDWLELMDAHEEMKMVVESTPRLSMEQVETMRGLLEAAGRLEETSPLAGECTEQLDLLERAHEEMSPVLERTAGVMAQIRQRLERVAEAHLSTTPYDAVVQDHDDELAGLQALRIADPVGVRHKLSSLEERLSGVRVWLDDILTALDRARTVMVQVDEVRDQAAAARAQGLLLTEDEANPDPMVSQVRQEHDAAMMALDRGEPDTAADYLEQAYTWAGRAGHAIAKNHEARQFCEASIPARRQRAAQLADKLHQAQAREDELRSRHHPSAWQSVAEHWAQADQILGGLGALLDKAEASAAADVQRYFHAEDLLVHIEQQQGLAAQLLDGIGLRLKELDNLREACRSQQREVEALGQDTDTFLQQNPAAISTETRELLGSVHGLRDTLHANVAAEPTDWTLVSHQLSRLDEGFRSVRAQADEEVRAHQEFTQAIDQTDSQARDVGTLLERHTEDRRRANAAYENARRELGNIQAERADPQPDWVGLARRLAGVREGLARADQWAREDINLARQAAAAIDRAESKIHQAKSYYRHGVSADVHRAYDMVGRARDRLFNREYERAIEEAAGVEREVQAAMTLAQRRTRDRQRELTRQRMAQVATTLVQAAAIAASARGGRSHSASRHLGRVGRPSMGARPTFPSRSWPRGDTRW